MGIEADMLISGIDWTSKFGEYPNSDILFGAYAIDPDGRSSPTIVVHSERGERILVATVNLAGSGILPQEDHVYIKTWSENEGVVAELKKHGIIEDPETPTTISVGHYDAQAELYKLTQKSLDCIRAGSTGINFRFPIRISGLSNG